MTFRVCSSLAIALLIAAGHICLAQNYTILPGDDPPSVSLNAESANNTSACFANGNPTYCNEALTQPCYQRW